MKEGLIPGTLLGLVVKDIITGFEGLAVIRTEFLNGCIRYHVQPMRLGDDNQPGEPITFDEQELTIMQKAPPKGLSVPAEPKIRMRSVVRDTVTLFEGVVTARATVVSGLPEVFIQPSKLDKNHNPIKGIFRPEETLTIIKEGPAPEPEPEPEPKPRAAKKPKPKAPPVRKGGPQRCELTRHSRQ